MAYNLETILAEKIETILSRSITNTRPRDFYDVFIIYKIHNEEVDLRTLKEALKKTSEKRGSLYILTEYEDIMQKIRGSDSLKAFWRRYQKDFYYARDIEFVEVCSYIEQIMNSINKQ